MGQIKLARASADLRTHLRLEHREHKGLPAEVCVKRGQVVLPLPCPAEELQRRVHLPPQLHQPAIAVYTNKPPRHLRFTVTLYIPLR